MTDLTRFWTITVKLPGETVEGYPAGYNHVESFGTSMQAFWRIEEIRSMMAEGIVPEAPISLVSDPAHRVA